MLKFSMNTIRLAKKFKWSLSNAGGPWGPWSGSGSAPSGKNSGDKAADSIGKSSSGKDSSGGFKPQNSEERNNQNKGSGGSNGFKKPDYDPKRSKDFDEFFKKTEDFLKNNFGKTYPGDGLNRQAKSMLGLIILATVFLWLTLGIYKVEPDENAAVLYFGKFYKIATPGLNYYIPYPFGEVIKKSVTTVNTEEFGFSSVNKKSEKRNLDAESLMLTGDENIVDIEFQVQWQISDIKDFVFNIAEPNQSIRKSAESAMREIIARTPIADALSDGKGKIEQETKTLLQEILDSYKAGVRVVLVQMRRVDPPIQVIDAFRDVQTAKADKEKEINQAQSYANDIIPRARGTASQMKEQAEAYSKEVVSNAEGEAGRFLAVYNEYNKSKQLTKKRIYIETMEKIYRDIDKVYIDRSAARSGVTSYFPLSELNNSMQQNQSKATSQVKPAEISTSNNK